MPNDYAEGVLDVAALIPPGHVLSYGDIAELLGAGGPRQVGAAMAGAGGAVPWWRVVRANGTLPAHLAAEAGARWAEEGTPRRGGAVAMSRARWEPSTSDLVDVERISARLGAPSRAGGAPNRRRRLL